MAGILGPAPDPVPEVEADQDHEVVEVQPILQSVVTATTIPGPVRGPSPNLGPDLGPRFSRH